MAIRSTIPQSKYGRKEPKTIRLVSTKITPTSNKSSSISAKWHTRKCKRSDDTSIHWNNEDSEGFFRFLSIRFIEKPSINKGRNSNEPLFFGAWTLRRLTACADKPCANPTVVFWWRCVINKEELHIWEMEQKELELHRFCPKKRKRLYDPGKERLFKRRKRSNYGRWDKELPSYKKAHKARIRAKYKLIEGDDALHPEKREYHTYGWLSWWSSNRCPRRNPWNSQYAEDGIITGTCPFHAPKTRKMLLNIFGI